MKVVLCDNKEEGHHKIYYNSLLQLSYTKLKKSDISLNSSLKKNFIKYFLERKNIMKEYTTDKNGIVHILTLDFIYMYPLLRKYPNIIGTLHHVPNSKLRRIFLKHFSKKIRKIIVHSSFLKEELLLEGINNVDVVNYPSFYNYERLNKEKIKSEYNFDKNKIIISLLGGTREDKGLNILLESMKYLSSVIKEKLIINVAGKEEFFKKEYIQSYEKEVQIVSNLKCLSDEEFIKNVFITDIMIMPYLKSFGGNSGPMTEAIVNKIPCIAPKELNIGKIVSKNNLGEIFECENPKDLARAIEKVINNISSYYTTNFYKTLTKENFLKSYEKIYQEIWREMEDE